MNARRNVVAGMLLVSTVTLSTAALAADTYVVDPIHSPLIFKIKHLGVSNFYGRFNEVTGTFTVDEKNPAASSVEINIKTESVDTNNPERNTHLKSPDFFNAKEFPVITFKSKKIKETAKDNYEVTGDLTLHGVTKPLAVKLTRIGTGKDPWGGFRMGFESTFTIKRSDFDMKFMADLVGDEVQLMLSIEGVKK